MRQLLFLSLIPLTLGFAIPSYAQPASPTSPDSITRLSGKPGLNLSDSQKAQMRALRQKTREQIMAVLTPSQRSQLASALQSGQSFRQAMRSLNLTDAQKQQIRAIRESSRQQRLAILTPEQRRRS